MSTAEYHPASFRDPTGRVVVEDDFVYRRLLNHSADFFELIDKDGRLLHLVTTAPLIQTELFDFDSERDGFDIRGLIHERILVQTYPWEWSFEMRRQAALATLDLLESCLDCGLILKDGTALNVTYHKGRMVWFDTLSIIPLKERDLWIGFGQFCQTQLFPLLIESYTNLDPRPFLLSRIDGFTPGQAQSILGWRYFFKSGIFKYVLMQAKIEKRAIRSKIGKGIVPGIAKGLPLSFLKANLQSIKKLVLGLENSSQFSAWENYEESSPYNESEADKKLRYVKEYLKRSGPKRVIDIGCNSGIYSQASAAVADRVISLDFDGKVIDRLFTRSWPEVIRRKIIPVVSDLTSPSPGHGWRMTESAPLLERIQSDVFLALAIVHHFCISKNVSISMFIDLLADIAPAGIVEWVDKEDDMVEVMLQTREDIFFDYREENFCEALKKRFQISNRIPLKGKTRVLYFLTALN